MPNLKEIKTRIGSVKKTRQITQAMKLVAAAKLRSATERALQAQPYQHKLKSVLGRVAEKAGGTVEDPLLQRRDDVKNVLLVLLTSDKGLCGGFNNGLLRHVNGFIAERKEQGVQVHIRVFGRKGRDFLKSNKLEIEDAVVEYDKIPKMDLVRPLADHMVAGFTHGEYDEVWFGYNHFVNAATQEPTFSKVLPLQVEADEEDLSETDVNLVDFVYEPDPMAIVGSLLPLYLRTLVLQSFLDTEAGEHGARMMAMDNATRNASDLIDRLSLEYNRARQAAITTEITEIVSGAEAL